LKLNTLFRFFGANFLGPLLQAGFVLFERDPDYQITTYNLTAEFGLACACLALLRPGRDHSRQDCRAGDGTEFRC